MMTHEEMIEKMLQNPEVRAEYERLQPEFALLCAGLEASKTQDEVAQLMHTSNRMAINSSR